ncbi:MAG TPA: prolipoprotein diacylglyceryl transferase [Propionicimonas sp.]|jgi:phosphatidylglycerol:prolipoprotein diacylglycerol transferase|uniref:prolipoprotein diacylglyceryl transferase n=1 Tax=Propionicimonas sp. TaxID=1955623 RepID=UPI002F3EF854
MQPVLFSFLGIDVQAYGVSKALAALVGAFVLGSMFERRGLPKESAHTLVLWATVWGFVGAKIYYLAEQLPNLTMHDLGGMGFTWFGGLIGGIAAALVVIRRHKLPLGTVAGLATVPLSLAYAIGRLGCLWAGDGTYGRPSDLPWAMSFPRGAVPTDVPVHPTPLYEAIAAMVIAVILWRLGRRIPLAVVFGAYLVLSGVSRFLVETLRINEPVLGPLTQPQLWSVLSVVVGTVIMARAGASARSTAVAATVDEPAPAPVG